MRRITFSVATQEAMQEEMKRDDSRFPHGRRYCQARRYFWAV